MVTTRRLTLGKDVTVRVRVRRSMKVETRTPSGVAKHDMTITWVIEHDSGTKVLFTVRNFRTKNIPGRDWIFRQPEKRAFTVVKGKRGELCLTLKHNHPRGKRGFQVHTYDALAGATNLDPELVIEWP